MKCEYCDKEHNGSFGTGRFCSRGCACGFSTKAKRKEINEKVSVTFCKPEGYTCPKCNLWFRNKQALGGHYRIHVTKRIFDDLKIDKSRRKWIIREQGHFCEVCKKKKWNKKPIPLEIDHIDGNPGNNDRKNLRIICPNCHAQTEFYKGRNANRKDVDFSSRKNKYKGLYKRQIKNHR